MKNLLFMNVHVYALYDHDLYATRLNIHALKILTCFPSDKEKPFSSRSSCKPNNVHIPTCFRVLLWWRIIKLGTRSCFHEITIWTASNRPLDRIYP